MLLHDRIRVFGLVHRLRSSWRRRRRCAPCWEHAESWASYEIANINREQMITIIVNLVFHPSSSVSVSFSFSFAQLDRLGRRAIKRFALTRWLWIITFIRCLLFINIFIVCFSAQISKSNSKFRPNRCASRRMDGPKSVVPHRWVCRHRKSSGSKMAHRWYKTHRCWWPAKAAFSLPMHRCR